MFGVILLSMIGINQAEAHTNHHHVHQRQVRHVKNNRHHHRRSHRPVIRHPGMKWVWVAGHWTRCHGHRHWVSGHWKLKRR